MKKAEKGFTLIEALVAFSILAVGLIGIYQSFAVSGRSTKWGQETEFALLFARSLADRVGHDLKFDVTPHHGHDENLNVDWEVEIKPLATHVATFNGEIRLYHVRVTISKGGLAARTLAILEMQRLGMHKSDVL